MNIMKLLFLMAITILCVNQTAMAIQKSENELSLGEKLVRQLWADMKARNMPAIEKTIAMGFQSVHTDGARDREEQIKLIQSLNMSKYTLNNIKVTQNGPVIVVTYFVSVAETIDGKRLSTKPDPRLSVFIKNDKGWQWISHVNLKSLK